MFLKYGILVLVKKTLLGEKRVNLILFQNKSPLMFFLTNRGKCIWGDENFCLFEPKLRRAY